MKDESDMLRTGLIPEFSKIPARVLSIDPKTGISITIMGDYEDIMRHLAKQKKNGE